MRHGTVSHDPSRFVYQQQVMSPVIDMVFDADCVLCSGAVHFILKHERAPTIRFINAWSKTGLALGATHGLTKADLDETYLVVCDGRGLTHSTAVLAIAAELRAPWSWGRHLWLVPRPIRDGMYSFIARRRYRWFGRKSQCFRAPPDQAHRFIDDRSDLPKSA